jgi:hypothetical protein
LDLEFPQRSCIKGLVHNRWWYWELMEPLWVGCSRSKLFGACSWRRYRNLVTSCLYASWLPWSRTGLFHHIFLAVMCCLATRPKATSQLIMDWNIQNHKLKQIFSPYKLIISGVLSVVESWLTQCCKLITEHTF